jgi:hypothetical protein
MSAIKVLEEKTIYSDWIKDTTFGIPVDIVYNEDGSVTATAVHSSKERTITAPTLNEALNLLNHDISESTITGDL